MFKYYKMFGQRYTDFTGRSRRSEFWFFYLVHWLMFAPLAIAKRLIIYRTNPATGYLFEDTQMHTFRMVFAVIAVLVLLYSLVALIPTIALIFRRLHDINMAWPWFLFV